jgi:hypothetical protein
VEAVEAPVLAQPQRTAIAATQAKNLRCFMLFLWVVFELEKWVQMFRRKKRTETYIDAIRVRIILLFFIKVKRKRSNKRKKNALRACFIEGRAIY